MVPWLRAACWLPRFNWNRLQTPMALKIIKELTALTIVGRYYLPDSLIEPVVERLLDGPVLTIVSTSALANRLLPVYCGSMLAQ